MRSQASRILLTFVFILPTNWLAAQNEKVKPPSPKELVRIAVRELVKMQEAPGQWPYERWDLPPDDKLPVAYRVASTSIVAQALLFAAPENKDAQTAVKRGLAFVLEQLGLPLMAPVVEGGDDRVWGHVFALEFLCCARACKVVGQDGKKVEKWIQRLVRALITEEKPDGGWSYGPGMQKPFVTAPAIQALLLARSQGQKAPDKIFERSRKALEAVRAQNGAFAYKAADGEEFLEAAPHLALGDSASRSPICETTLMLLGGGSTPAVQFALDNFFRHWNDLEKRRRKSGTHGGPYGIAPYFFYFGHRYAAQAIQMLPTKDRAKERTRLLKAILQTRDVDGTWNDRDFPRGRSYGTAMVVLALLGDRAPLPPKFVKQ